MNVWSMSHGVTYRNQNPFETPDDEWMETIFEAKLVDPQSIKARQAQIDEQNQLKELEQQVEKQAMIDRITLKEQNFQKFLAGENVNRIWSDYDLDRCLYTHSNSPLCEYPEDYQAEHVGSGLGYWCKDSKALTRLYEFIRENGRSHTRENLASRIQPYDFLENGTPRYTAGAQYYRWLAAQ